MKKASALAALLLAAAVIAGGCSSDSSNPVGPDPTGPLMPLTKGSTWSYKAAKPYTLTVIGDSTINGTVWMVMNHSLDGTMLMRKEGSVYYGFDIQGKKAIEVLRDSTVGTTWTYDKLSPSFTPNRYEFTMAERGLKKKIDTVEYSGVVRVHVVQSTFNSLNNSWGVSATYDQYYAPSVGMIEQDEGIFGKTDLTSYLIK